MIATDNRERLAELCRGSTAIGRVNEIVEQLELEHALLTALVMAQGTVEVKVSDRQLLYIRPADELEISREDGGYVLKFKRAKESDRASSK